MISTRLQVWAVERLTFWVLVVGLLQVLDDAVLADELLDLALGFDVEGVLVEQGNLVMSLALSVLCLLLPHSKCLSPAVGVVGSSSEFGVAALKVSKALGLTQELLSHTLWVWLLRRRVRRVTSRWLPLLTDQDGQHLAILDARIF
jgi:hypothetical protein